MTYTYSNESNSYTMYCIIVYNMYCTQQENKILMINNNFKSNTAVVIIRNHIDSKCYAQTPPRAPCRSTVRTILRRKVKTPAAFTMFTFNGDQWGRSKKINDIFSIYGIYTHIYIYTVYKLYIYILH